MKYLITFILLFFVPVAEATTAPDWVLGKGHPKYNTVEYVIGIGHSDKSTVTASESARADLIKNIRVKVSSVLKDYTSTDKSFTESSIVSESEFLLEGSQVKDGWYDEKKDTFYSFVVIKRSYVADTLMEMIGVLVSKNDLTLRQADTFFNDGNVLKALIYYYDGYVESSKITPYIQTYNSVLLSSNKMALGKDYSLLFKEKIQNIVDNITLNPVNQSMTDDIVDFTVKVLYRKRPIEFPVKFYSMRKHYTHKQLCKKEGCGLKVNVLDVMGDRFDFYLMSEIDTKTLKKYFSYELEPKLFKRLELAEIKFKRGLTPTRPGNVHREIERARKERLSRRMNREVQQYRNRKERIFRQMDRTVQRGLGRYGRPDIDLSPLRRSGSINFRLRLGF